MKLITNEKIEAAILFEQRKPLVFENIELQDELEIGQVFVKLHTSGICGSQIGEIIGTKGPDKYLPHLSTLTIEPFHPPTLVSMIEPSLFKSG